MVGDLDAGRAVAAEIAERVAGADLLARTARYALSGRLSGSPALETVLGRVADDLRALGLAVAETRVPALTSRPGRALVRLGGTIYPGQSVAFGAPATDRHGPALRGGGLDPGAWLGAVVVLDGLPGAEIVALAEASGAHALVALLEDEAPHLVGVSPVWGSPTPWTVGGLPGLPIAVLSGEVAAGFARRLAEAAGDGRAPRVSVSAGVDTRWREIALLTADIAGPDEAFVLVGSHADAWFEGAMDNAAGVAVAVETAAALAAAGRALRRGVRLAFWSGHEDAGHAGAQAYADRQWEALERRAAAYVQVAAPGGRGNTDLGGLGAMPETAFLVRDAVRAITGEATRPPGVRPGDDRSFAGVGLASAHVGGGRPPDRPDWPRGRAWHSPGDTLDGLDAGLLARDGAVAAHAVAQAAARAAEPVDLAAGARALETAVGAWRRRLEGRLDLGEAERRSACLVERCEALARAVAQAGDRIGAEANAATRAAGRPLVRLAATGTSRFDHDPALPLGVLPTLGVCASLLDSAPGSAPQNLAAVAAVRARTAVEVSLRETAEGVERALARTAAVRRAR